MKRQKGENKGYRTDKGENKGENTGRKRGRKEPMSTGLLAGGGLLLLFVQLYLFVNKRLYAGAAALLHKVYNVGVCIQRGLAVGVAQVALQRLHIVTGKEGNNGVTVAEIMETGVGDSGTIKYFFVVLIHRAADKELSGFVGKYEI